MKALRSLDRILAGVEGWLIILLLWLMVTLTFVQVVLRALYTHLHLPWASTLVGQMDWAEPMVRLSVLWITFLGASLLTQDNKHIKIDLFSSILPPSLLPYRGFLLSLASAVISAFMVKASIGYLRSEMTFGTTLFLGIPAWACQLILPVGFLLIFFRFLLRGVEEATAILRGRGT